MILYQHFCILFILGTATSSIISRSIHHSSSKRIPGIVTQWCENTLDTNPTKKYELYHNNLEVGPIFHQYDRTFFINNLLPDNIISPRHTTSTHAENENNVSGAELKKLLESLVEEIQSLDYRRSEYKDFIVIKQRDFNPKTHAGLIILKFKNHPFVVKLFMETPETFVSPFSKGFEPMVFFIMGGGINRYLSGFSRVKNAQAIRKNIAESPLWSNRVDLPRKWFWEPVDQKWFKVTSKNLGSREHTVQLPSIYAIVCDAIDIETPLKIFNPEHRQIGMELSHFIGSRIDPHIDNFGIERETGMIVIVDTECFSIMVGLREPLECANYANWYCGLCVKCLKDGFCRSKQERFLFQQQDQTTIICCSL